MNRIFYLILSTLVLTTVTSCGGWSEDQKTQLKNNCIGSGTYDCDCYVKTITEKYENSDDYNKLDQSAKDELLKDCVVEVEAPAEEEIESF